MTPLVTIQVMGLVGSLKQKAERKRLQERLKDMEDTIVYFD